MIFVRGSIITTFSFDGILWDSFKAMKDRWPNDIWVSHLTFIRNATPNAEEALRNVRLASGGVDFIVQPPQHHAEFPLRRPTVLYTALDSQYIDPAFHPWLNAMEHILVPSHWIRQQMTNSGITAPITVLQHHYRDVYRVGNRQRDVCRFGLSGQVFDKILDKKNIHKGIEGFLKAFPTQTDVRLSVKIPASCDFIFRHADPRIEFIHETWNHQQMADWYNTLTCFVHVSMCEGFGVMPVEAMACGTPIMSTNFSGMSEYTTTPYYNLEYAMIDKNDGVYPNTKWADPKMDCIVAKYREIYEHPKEAWSRGMIASEYVKKFRYDVFKDRLCDFMKDYL